MKLADVAIICVVGGLLVGCEHRVSKQDASRKLDTELVNVLNNIGLENAIVMQHTLYPYHFIQNSDQLNELGQRDLGVLAKHFQKYPGALSIRRGDAPAELYDARVAQAVEKLRQAGVKTDLVQVSDGMPGGAGMASERVIKALRPEPPEDRSTEAWTITRKSSSKGYTQQ
jgi:hypothetical protein